MCKAPPTQRGIRTLASPRGVIDESTNTDAVTFDALRKSKADTQLYRNTATAQPQRILCILEQ